MGLVALLVVLNHLPYDIPLTFITVIYGCVADVKYLVDFKLQVYYIYLLHCTINRFVHSKGLNFFIYCHVKISKYHALT